MARIMIAVIKFKKSNLRCWQDSKIANGEALPSEDSEITYFEEVLPLEDLCSPKIMNM